MTQCLRSLGYLTFLILLFSFGKNSAQAATFNVTVAPGGSLTFNPATLNIAVGDTVTWTWSGSGHDVVCDNPLGSRNADPFCGNSPNAPQLFSGGFSFSHTYTQANTYQYYCSPHRFSGMTGTVIVSAGANTPPTISAIGNQSIAVNGTTGPISFTVGDAETAVGSLNVSGNSGNQTLVPNGNISFGGSGASRTVTVTPAANQSGTTTITLTVTDGGGLTATRAFDVTVTAGNTAPTISLIGNQSIAINGTTGPISFTVGDAETAVGSLTLSGSSGNQTLVPNGNITFGGSGASRTVTVTPAAGQSGTAVITVTVTDGGGLTASSGFNLTVTAGNTAPAISSIADRTLAPNTATGQIPFTIGDAETAAANLTLTADSSNPGFVPVTSIVFGGSGANRTVNVAPNSGQTGSSLITVTVMDGGGLTASSSFTVNVVAPGNTSPTISSIANRNIAFNSSTGPISFTVGDAETAAASLTLSATSSNPGFIPIPFIVFGGTDADRTVNVTPNANSTGSSLITVKVTDGGGLSTSTSFTVTIPNSLPTISAIPNQNLPYNGSAGPISFTIGDLETDVTNLTLTATSTNTSFVPVSAITFGGSGASRTVTVTPATNQTGASTITVTVTDGGGLTAASSFTVTILNGTPTISAIADQFVTVNGTVGPVAFTVGDAETPAGSLVVTASSTNVSLLPVSGVTFGGSGANRSMTLRPNTGQSGQSRVTLTVSDGGLTANTSFLVTVATNKAPTISIIGDQVTDEDTPTVPIPFDIGDVETPASNLVVIATSASQALVSNNRIIVGGSETNRTLTITPNTNEFGATTITVVVTDGGGLSATNSFNFTVNSVNDLPTASITSPVDGVTMEAPTNILITAAASDADGFIVKVELFEGTNLLSTITSGAYQFTMSNVMAGAYALTAVATDDQGGTATSSTALVIVQARIQSPQRLTNGTFQFSLTGSPTGRTNVLEYSTNPPVWFPLRTNISTGGTLDFTDPAATNDTRRFYRVRQLQ